MIDRLRNRYHGTLLGLATGDALGTTLEFRRPATFAPIDDIVGGGPFHLAPGKWTDDTSMALCLAESLIGRRGFDPLDQLERYVRWWRDGHLSSNGRCFDIGTTVRTALARFERTHSSTGIRRRSGARATSYVHSRPPCGRSIAPTRSATARCSRSTSATTRTRPAQSTDSSRARTTASRGSRRRGARGSRTAS